MIKKIEEIKKSLTENTNDKKVSKNEVLKTDLVRKIAERSKKMEVKFKKLEENAIIPYYAHPGDIGMDITCTNIEYDEINDAFIYHTGLACETNKGLGCFLMPRSSNTKTDSYLPNSIGLIDTYTYRGELLFIFKNRTDTDLLAAISALTIYDEMPFWKKIFTSYRSVWEKEVKNMKQNALQFAPYEIGDRIGQMVFFEYPSVIVKEVNELTETERGEGGFGSTGK